ncbi:uncharacterized protein RJT21DRAFT_204 [Scheffersomyces amazonensis]|uniref:uncharacterized protein n=1 Tax=Scheffersomyces amazonensis TaxID=1078765 RepID=UPI00315D8DAF
MSSNLYLPRLVPQSYWPGDFESDFSSEDLKYPVSRSSFTSSQYQQHQQQQQPQHQQPSSTGSSQHHMPQFVSDSMPVSRPDHKGFLFSNDANEPNSQPNIPHSSQPAPKDPPNSHGSSQNNVSQPRNSHQTDGNSNSNSGDSLFGYSLGDSHSQVKIERSPYTLSKIPDREFPGDYEDDSDSDQVSNRTPIRRGSSVLQVPATASLSSGSKVLSTLVDSSLSQEVYTLAELNQFPMNIDKKVYNVNAYIVGILPEDLSYVVSKTYEFDHSLEKYIPGDPTARSLEFILTDEVPPSLSSQNNLCLTQDNSLKIMIPARHIVEFFNSQSIEEIYMALPEFNKYFYENLELISKTLFKFQLFKTKVAIKPEEREVVWTARNFSVRELLSNSGLPDM